MLHPNWCSRSMARNPYSPPTSEVVMSPNGPVSMNWYGFLCFLGLAVAIVVLTLVTALTGVRFPTGTLIVGLLLSIQFATWRFVQTYRRAFLPIELKRFAWTCFLVFWVCDESPAIVRAFSTPAGWSIEKIATAILATGVDFAVVAVIVYVTVPWAAKHLLLRTVA